MKNKKDRRKNRKKRNNKGIVVNKLRGNAKKLRSDKVVLLAVIEEYSDQDVNNMKGFHDRVYKSLLPYFRFMRGFQDGDFDKLFKAACVYLVLHEDMDPKCLKYFNYCPCCSKEPRWTDWWKKGDRYDEADRVRFGASENIDDSHFQVSRKKKLSGSTS